ncbi:GIMA7 GTPase, partial [Polyodon spathula]|nr:GIMA7 GTPase [Polyodon spathula]
MAVFTRGDDLEGLTIEEYIETTNKHLKELLRKYGNRCHVFNNKNMSDRTQVTELLEKIDKMVEANRGKCCTNENYKKVEMAIEKEKKRTMKENSGYNEEDARKKAEQSNAFINKINEVPFERTRDGAMERPWRQR